ncbi:MAG TPA: NAD-dependent epimerase/dehydratase family protein [Gaiellaceae bacterium]|nr:NAD-dependent epimerase/dehydratase family protein [Gaiellaceae bacterium]
MRAFVTGGTGFLGGRLVERLRGRGDEVVALVRSPEKARRLAELGCVLAEGDLSSRERLADAMRGCDAVFHVAADYRIGIRASERAAMFEVNVAGTRNVLDAAAGAGRVVYVSTNSVVGNTRGAIVDETYVRAGGPWLSAYDESKFLAHRLVEERIAGGAPIVVVQPGGIYGPGDHTGMGPLLARAFRGNLVFLPVGSVGLNWGHVDDVAAGVLLAHDHGKVGDTYILGGEIATLRQAVEQAFAAGGHRPRIVPVPTVLLRLAVPLGPLLGRNVREILSASDGVTYWASDAKARRELGYAPSGLAEGLRRTFAG